jgi:hypothetical protein
MNISEDYATNIVRGSKVILKADKLNLIRKKFRVSS